MVITRDGEKITLIEAFKRFKQGVDEISPLQKLKIEKRGLLITILGFLASMIAVIIMREKIGLLSYGLILIFLGSLISSISRYLSLRKQYSVLKNYQEESIDISKILDSQEAKEVESSVSLLGQNFLFR